jgi:hypothetical protein
MSATIFKTEARKLLVAFGVTAELGIFLGRTTQTMINLKRLELTDAATASVRISTFLHGPALL